MVVGRRRRHRRRRLRRHRRRFGRPEFEFELDEPPPPLRAAGIIEVKFAAIVLLSRCLIGCDGRYEGSVRPP
jgi:hypothetical protein